MSHYDDCRSARESIELERIGRKLRERLQNKTDEQLGEMYSQIFQLERLFSKLTGTYSNLGELRSITDKLVKIVDQR